MRSFYSYAETTPDRAAVVDPPDGTTTSFGDLAARVNQLTHLIVARDLDPGASVCVLLPNGAALLAVQRAVLQQPLYLTTINWHFAAPPEVAHILQDSDARIVFTTAEYARLVREACLLAGLPTDRIVELDRTGGNAEVEAHPLTRPESSAGGSRMLYTSGTTGKPKGGVRRPLPAGGPDAVAAAAVERAEKYDVNHEGGVYLSVAPMYHAAPPLSYADQALEVGHTVVILPRWSAVTALDAIEQYQVTWAYLVPLMMQDMLEVRDSHRVDVSSLRTVIHTAAPCPPSVKRAMIDWLGPVLNEVYGGTEGVGHAHHLQGVAGPTRIRRTCAGRGPDHHPGGRTVKGCHPARSGRSTSRTPRRRSNITTRPRRRNRHASRTRSRWATSDISTTTGTSTSATAPQTPSSRVV